MVVVVVVVVILDEAERQDGAVRCGSWVAVGNRASELTFTDLDIMSQTHSTQVKFAGRQNHSHSIIYSPRTKTSYPKIARVFMTRL